MKAQYEAWMGHLLKGPHCTVLPHFKQRTPLVLHQLGKNNIGCPLKSQLGKEVVHAAKEVLLQTIKVRCQGGPESQGSSN